MSCPASLSISLAHSWASPSVWPPIFFASPRIVSRANFEPKGNLSSAFLEEFSEDSVLNCASLLVIGHHLQPVSFKLSQAFEHMGMFRRAFALMWTSDLAPPPPQLQPVALAVMWALQPRALYGFREYTLDPIRLGPRVGKSSSGATFTGGRVSRSARRLGSPQDSAVLRSSLFGKPPPDPRGLHCRAVNP
jgi:hypothetical protein